MLVGQIKGRVELAPRREAPPGFGLPLAIQVADNVRYTFSGVDVAARTNGLQVGKTLSHICAMCGSWARGSHLQFVHERREEEARLELPLCSSCGDRLEKHLKRAVPGRLMAVTRLAGA